MPGKEESQDLKMHTCIVMTQSMACSLHLDAHCAGAVAVRMRVYDTSVSLINCHLSSGQNEGDSLKRHSDCEEIARRALYPHDGQSADLDVSFTLDMSDKVRCALIDPSVLAVDISLCVLLLLCSLAKCSLICIALSHMQPSSISLAIGPRSLRACSMRQDQCRWKEIEIARLSALARLRKPGQGLPSPIILCSLLLQAWLQQIRLAPESATWRFSPQRWGIIS